MEIFRSVCLFWCFIHLFMIISTLMQMLGVLFRPPTYWVLPQQALKGHS